MRVTSTSYYNSIYGDNNKLNRQLFDVSKQISSGQKIEYVHEAPGIFIDTLRLDSEIVTLKQTKNSALNAYKFSTQTDTTIGEIVQTLESMKVKLVNASNDVHSDASLQAIAKELRSLENHLKTLANTSINGQYIFAGTATANKPIDNYGNYQGNDEQMSAFLGSGLKQKYNISGSQLFFGNESKVSRLVTTNVPQTSLTELYPDIMQSSSIPRSTGKETYINGLNSIRDLMGDTDGDPTNDAGRVAYFYVQGTRSDGTSIKSKIAMTMDDSVDDLLHKIALAYDPNQLNPSANSVNVSLNAHGQIEIADKLNGSSKLEFHMVGAVDFNDLDAGDAADISDPALYAASLNRIENLQGGTTDFETAAITSPGLYIKEFIKSPNNSYRGNSVTSGALAAGGLIINGKDIGALTILPNDSDNALINAINALSKTTGVIATHNPLNGITLNSLNGNPIIVSGTDNGTLTGLMNQTYNLGSLQYDDVFFSPKGATLTSNISQIVKADNTLATDSTSLLSVASGDSLDGNVLSLKGNDINGRPYDISINLLNAGSTVTVNSAQGIAAPITFNLEDATGASTSASNVTYRQLMDIVNMAVTNKLPVAPSTYSTALANANSLGSVKLDYAGRIVFQDKANPITRAAISMYDSTSNTYPAVSNIVDTGASLLFNANNALTVRDPKNDFFAQINQMISSVEQGKKRPNGTDPLDPRNIGVQNSMQMLDDLIEHVSRMQSESGSYSQVLDLTVKRSDMLIVTTKTLRSEVIDTDIAEATLRIQQLTLNYQALLSNIAKVSQLSLVNYL